MGGGVVALGDEDVVVAAVLKGLVEGDGGTLFGEIVSIWRMTGFKEGGQNTYHELLLDLAEALDTRGELEVVVRRGLSNGRDDGDPVALGADVVRGGDASNVDIWIKLFSTLLSTLVF